MSANNSLQTSYQNVDSTNTQPYNVNELKQTLSTLYDSLKPLMQNYVSAILSPPSTMPTSQPSIQQMSVTPTSTTTPIVPNRNKINDNLDVLNFDLSHNVAPAILSKQQDMKDIIDAETSRLQTKERSINELTDSKKRMIQLNNNFIERKEQYTKMLIAVVIGLAIFLFLRIIGLILPIPGFLMNIIFIIIILTVSFYCYQTYVILLSRDKLDFEKINTTPPLVLHREQIQSNLDANVKKGNLLGTINLGLCQGSDCCDAGTEWDVSNQHCVSKNNVIQGFQLMSNTENANLKTRCKMSGTSSYIPNEEDHYYFYNR